MIPVQTKYKLLAFAGIFLLMFFGSVLSEGPESWFEYKDRTEKERKTRSSGDGSEKSSRLIYYISEGIILSFSLFQVYSIFTRDTRGRSGFQPGPHFPSLQFCAFPSSV